MTRPSPLDDPDHAAFAWARYWRLMRLMFVITTVVTVVMLGLLFWRNGLISIHFYIATGLGIIATMMLMAGLMGLVFMSSGTGHDEAIDDRLDREADDMWDGRG